MTALLHDLRFALRQLRKHLGFTAVAVLTLAVGIAAATVVFSLVDAVLLRPLPFPEPDRVVSVGTVVKGAKQNASMRLETYGSWPDFFDLRRGNTTLEALSGYHSSNMSIGRTGTALRRISGTATSAGMAKALGLRMQLGRDFLPSEELAGDRSVILTDALWHTDLAADPAVLGHQVRLDGDAYTVVGVLPRGFAFPGAEDSLYWVTEARDDAEGTQPNTQRRGNHMLQAIGRLRDGVSASQAKADLTRIQTSLAVQFPDSDAQNDYIAVIPLAATLTGDVRQPLRILLAAVGFLLLISCVNVAGLLLTRTVRRSGELAVRAALGASRLALLRQLLLESMALAFAGGLLGTALAAGALHLAPRYLPSSLPHAAQVALDMRVLFFAFGLSVLTGLLFGVLPAWRASRLQPAAALQGNGRGSTAGRNRHRLHGTLVVAETALSMLLLVGAGLLLRSFQHVLTINPGFDAQGLLTFRVAVPSSHFTDQQQARFAQNLQARLTSLPGVSAATYAMPMPLAGGNMRFGFSIKSKPTPPGEGLIARLGSVAPDFFHTMAIPLLRGRTFTPQENQPGGPKAVIIDQAFAQTYFAGEDPLNKYISFGASTGDPVDLPIVGIVGNIKRKDLTETTQAEYYVPFGQNVFGPPAFALRTSADPMQFADTVRRVVTELDPALPVFNTFTYSTLLERNTAMLRFQTILLTGFAAVALLLAAIGLYASLSYMVLERTSELGLRMALGAQRHGIVSLVLHRGLFLAATGLAFGLLGAAALTRFVGSLLYNTRALDTLTFTATALLLFAVCALSSLIPALRASRLNPIDTLRRQ